MERNWADKLADVVQSSWFQASVEVLSTWANGRQREQDSGESQNDDEEEWEIVSNAEAKQIFSNSKNLFGEPGELNDKKVDVQRYFNKLGRGPTDFQLEPIFVCTKKLCDKVVGEIVAECGGFVGYDTEMYNWKVGIPWVQWPEEQKHGRKPFRYHSEWGNFIRTIQIALKSGKTYVFDIFALSKCNVNIERACDLPESLIEILTSQNIKKIVFDGNVELKAYERSIHYGSRWFESSMIDIKEICEDLSPHRQHNLRQMIFSIFGVKINKKSHGHGQQWNKEVLTGTQLVYAAKDAICTIDLAIALSILRPVNCTWMDELLKNPLTLEDVEEFFDTAGQLFQTFMNSFKN